MSTFSISKHTIYKKVEFWIEFFLGLGQLHWHPWRHFLKFQKSIVGNRRRMLQKSTLFACELQPNL